MTTQANETLVRLNNVRLSFPHLSAPRPARAMPDGSITKPKFEAAFLLQPNSQDWNAFLTRVMALLTEKYKEHAQQAFQKFSGDRKTRCFGKGEEVVSQETFQVLSGYAGMLYINAKSDAGRPPKLYGADGNPIMDASQLYGGCYVNAYIQPWIQTSHGGAIRSDLIAVQFSKDGEAFGAAPIDTDGLFQPVEGAPPPVSAPAGDMGWGNAFGQNSGDAFK